MFGDRLRLFRERAALTQDRVAELLCAELDRPTFTRNEISRYERGVRTPAVPTLRALARVLGVELRELEAARSGLDVDQSDRLAYTMAYPDRTDRASVEALALLLAEHRRLEDVVGAAPVISAVDSTAHLVTVLAGQCRAVVRPMLVGLASEVQQYLGWLAIPIGRLDDADRHLDRAIALGMQVDDPQRTATALSYKAYVRLHHGDIRGTVAYNSAARRDRRVHIGPRTYSAYQAAEMLARDGDRHGAQRELVAAERLTERLPGPEELPPWGYWYTREFFAGNRAFALDALGDHRQARELMAESMAAMPTDWQCAEWSEHRRRLLARA